MTVLIRLSSFARKQKRLQERLARRELDASLRSGLQQIQIRGSLELAGFATTEEDVAAACNDRPASVEARRLWSAVRAVDPGEPYNTIALFAWHAALVGEKSQLRSSQRTREGTAPAPPAFIAGRIEILEQWLSEESSHQLGPAQQGALVMARLIEILPFEEANGRVARLAASHVMVRAGLWPPLLGATDAERLRQALGSAFRFETEALTVLLEEASERSVDWLLAHVPGEVPSG